VHLVGFIIRIYHDAWSPERQILMLVVPARKQILKKTMKCDTCVVW